MNSELFFFLFVLFTSWNDSLTSIKLNLINFFNVSSLLNLLIHFFKFSLQLILLFIIIIISCNFPFCFDSAKFPLVAKSQIPKLPQNPHILHLVQTPHDFGVPEFGCVVVLEICEFFQKSRNLCDDSEQILWSWMVVHFESLNWFIVLDHWVEWMLL